VLLGTARRRGARRSGARRSLTRRRGSRGRRSGSTRRSAAARLPTRQGGRGWFGRRGSETRKSRRLGQDRFGFREVLRTRLDLLIRRIRIGTHFRPSSRCSIVPSRLLGFKALPGRPGHREIARLPSRRSPSRHWPKRPVFLGGATYLSGAFEVSMPPPAPAACFAPTHTPLTALQRLALAHTLD
jgi:hypothetical protein